MDRLLSSTYDIFNNGDNLYDEEIVHRILHLLSGFLLILNPSIAQDKIE